MEKLLGQRKKFNLALATSGSSDFEELRAPQQRYRPASPPPIVPVQFNRYNISLTIREDGSLFINTATSDNADDSEDHTIEPLPKVRKQQRSNSARSNKSSRTIIARTNDDYDDTSDDEAFMNNEDNFLKSPRPLRRSLRKRKTSSLKRRPGIQTVPENPKPVVPVHQSPAVAAVEVECRTVTALDDTLENAELSLEWIENEYYSTEPNSSENGESGCHVLSEKSLLIANAETEDALSDDYSDGNAGNPFKMPYPVNYRQINLAKRKLVVESDEEYIAKTFRAPVKRSCIRYYNYMF